MSQQSEELVYDPDHKPPLPAGMPPRIRAIVGTIDRTNEILGEILAWTTFALIFVVAIEVVRRYGFNDPSIWAYDVSYMLYGTGFMLGAAVTLRYRGHIRTDLFYQNWSDRTKALVDACFYLFVFFPGLFLFMLAGFDKAWHSFSIMERAFASPWRPLLFPYRAVIPLCALLLIIQGISELLKAVYVIRAGSAR